MSNCYKCGDPDHYAAACTLSTRADNPDEHQARIAAIIDRWIRGEISIEQKRIKISDENVQWYGDGVPRHLVYSPGPRD